MRNPRRAYEKDGTEIPPMDLRAMRAHGVRSVDAQCLSCKHERCVTVDQLPESLPVPDVSLRLRCAECGSRNIYTRPSWTGFNPTGLGKR